MSGLSWSPVTMQGEANEGRSTCKFLQDLDSVFAMIFNTELCVHV